MEPPSAQSVCDFLQSRHCAAGTDNAAQTAINLAVGSVHFLHATLGVEAVTNLLNTIAETAVAIERNGDTKTH
jgi:hypothetical protein